MSKAWICSNPEYSRIIFSETRNNARSIALGLIEFETDDYIDINAKRIRELDNTRPDGYVFQWENEADNRVLWQMGWYPDYVDSLTCSECGRYEYDTIPESKIHESGVCLNCLGDNK